MTAEAEEFARMVQQLADKADKTGPFSKHSSSPLTEALKDFEEQRQAGAGAAAGTGMALAPPQVRRQLSDEGRGAFGFATSSSCGSKLCRRVASS